MSGFWVCPECCFAYDAVHTVADGSYSCPCCAEMRLEKENATLRAQVAQLREALEAREILEAHLRADKGPGLSRWLERRDELESWERDLRRRALEATK